MVAGFLAGYLNTKDYEKALELGTAAGSATAFVSWLATKEEIIGKLVRPASEYGLQGGESDEDYRFVETVQCRIKWDGFLKRRSYL